MGASWRRLCSSSSLLGVGDPQWVYKPWLISDFQLGLAWFFPSSALAVGPVCPCAVQTHLVLIGWIPDGTLRGICWEIPVRSQRWPRLLVVQGWMVCPVSGRQCGGRAGWRGRWWRYHGKTSLDRSRIVDPQIRLWSGSHGWRWVRYNGRDRGSVGEVSCEGLVRHTVHCVARVGLHRCPHVAIYWRVVYVIDVARTRSRLCLHPAVHASLSGREGLVTVGARQQWRLVRRCGTEVMLLRDCGWCLQVRTLTSKLQVPGIICKENGIRIGCIKIWVRLRTYLCVWSSGTEGRGLCWGGSGLKLDPGCPSSPREARLRTDKRTGLEDDPWELLQPASLPGGCGRRWASGGPSSWRSLDILCYTSAAAREDGRWGLCNTH